MRVDGALEPVERLPRFPLSSIAGRNVVQGAGFPRIQLHHAMEILSGFLELAQLKARQTKIKVQHGVIAVARFGPSQVSIGPRKVRDLHVVLAEQEIRWTI